ncbi:MAG TPA: HlyD family efflux transporter periplasmic adaptor subunit, partial [Stellaceae bacterium]|nr:HlyD family efflux transporter periplasmic adaptor subunit [Stellaceae bacterium]
AQNRVPIQGTQGQDTVLTTAAPTWRRRLWTYGLLGAALLLAAAFVYAIRAWSQSQFAVSATRLSIATVVRGPFVRDVAADGTVVAAVNPTLFAIAPGTISYAVHAGDGVTKGQVLATLDSPELRNEYLRERASLDGLTAALARQEIEIRRQLLTSKQHADLAQVAIQAAERELKRNQWAWDLHAIPERDYQRAVDEVATAKLNFEHARDTANLERDSVALDLRSRRLERDRQALVVADLERRVGELAIRSPVNGMVANLAQQDKADIAANSPVVTVVDLSAFELEFHVAETYAHEVKPQMRAVITLGGRSEPGIVTAISPEVRENEVVGRVRFSGGQPPGLRQNERASVRILLDDREGVLKFERGSLIDEATRAVYLVRGDRAIRVPVELGPASVTEIQIVRGLTVGDRVVISDTREFNDAPELFIGR